MVFNEMLPNGVSGLTMLELRRGLYSAISSGPGANVVWKLEETFVYHRLEVEDELTQLERLPIDLSTASKN
ncbi:hypothetical protein N7516_007908 [Penicillium verrucosum]|uniref:uncharacterized protein n=1 Tax=Penicillium verrucosum TaxID=60171 RepID=UPI002545B47A|nr:uncharacterized protein N7516_007908 [Penicillium verrucosum]KAJ5926135.1 hypothetical protein N7516_007908 [Penicillium verrucosum]